jgi:hypothetical protein
MDQFPTEPVDVECEIAVRGHDDALFLFDGPPDRDRLPMSTPVERQSHPRTSKGRIRPINPVGGMSYTFRRPTPLRGLHA